MGFTDPLQDSLGEIELVETGMFLCWFTIYFTDFLVSDCKSGADQVSECLKVPNFWIRYKCNKQIYI